MAKYKVITSYGGKISATAGEVVEYKDKSIISDLLSAGYIEEVKAGTKPAEPSKASKTKTAKATKKEQKED